MNGLTLRISRGGASKQKNPIAFSPVSISTSVYQYSGTNLLFKQFIVSTSTDDQLAILKKILEQTSDVLDIEVNQFLVVLFLEAEAKHPVKCFVSRHVTKSNNLHQPFTEALAAQISRYISIKLTDYKQYVVVVSKIATCVENFNAGVAAVRSVEGELAVYLKDCLYCCSGTLRENSTLSPTEKNQIYNLAHLSLRLLLHIIQKSSQNSLGKLHLIFGDIRSNINELMRGMDVPMDTKSVCGILYLWMHIIENGPLSWINVLNSGELHCESLGEAAQLSLLSAIPTVVGVDQLQTVVVEGTSAVVVLVKRLLDIGDRSSSESTFILCVTRTIVQISKCLDKLTDTNIGVTLVDMFLVFAWTHLEHYMDSVRHLTAQMLACVVKYSVRLDREGDSSALSKLSMALASLDKSRKSYYISLACLSNELGAKSLLVMMPNVIEEGIHALYSQPVQASASVFLDTLLQKYVSEFTTAELYKSWVVPVLRAVSTHAPECSVFNAMEHLLIRAVKLDERLVNYIIPYIKESCELTSKARDLKCILMLLAVVRKSGVTSKLTTLEKDDEWKGIISYEVLKTAAIDSVDETRVLSLSLIVESPKSTEQSTEGDLSFILWYLKYNINAQAPNFRQHTLSFMKKFLKRFEDSYKAMRRQIQPISKHNKVDYYLQFIRELRHQCFESVIPGVNYSRRYVGLQILAWCEDMNLEGYHKCWQSEYVERMLIHFEDSYESNKALALDILCGCDVDLIKSKKYSTSLEIKDIFRQASSLKPTDCVSAAYKLDFLRRKLPEYILQDEKCDIPDPVTYTLVKKLVVLLEEEVSVCEESVVLAARRAPMYGLLHCIGHLLETVDPIVISPDSKWKCLVSTLILLCERVSVAVSVVVNNSSPEGHLPMDMTGVTLTDHGNSGNVRLEDGRPVTAQMVLLCAWRSVKEVSLLLGSISSRLTIAGEGLAEATLDVEQVTAIGEHFTSLLAETKHRGAFEQAYVGFTKYLTRLWRCKNPELHERPRVWLQELLEAISSGDRRPLCATRRSAGLPFMIQALVSTELQAGAAPQCLHRCMGALLALGRGTETERRETETEVSCRTHSLNVLRALFRNSVLQEGLTHYVGEGLLLALSGFDGNTWAERNSSTLLFSALTVRVFGVPRDRRLDVLNVRNRMTGRIFFLRYPKLYDFMLEKLKEVTSSGAGELSPCLSPVLLLLARLYPSALEGTVSNLKLVSFVPHVLSCASSSVLHTRQLAAKAIVPLISPEHYIAHIQSMFELISNVNVPRNFCHGILLQLLRLLDAKPQDLQVDMSTEIVVKSLWVLEQAVGDVPCYLIADEYIKVLNMIVWRFPGLLQKETANQIIQYLHTLIFISTTPKITSGRDICLSNAIYFYYILLHTYNLSTTQLVYKALEHPSYEVVLSTLNYLLVTHNSLDQENCKFIQHLIFLTNNITLEHSKERYFQLLCRLLKSEYLECQQKSLKLLILNGNTQKYIIEAKFGKTTNILDKLFDCVGNEHENLTHVYLQSLLNYITELLKDSSVGIEVVLKVIRVIFECSSSDNSERTRNVVVKFMGNNIKKLFSLNTSGLSDENKFELKATIWAIIITLLEDDDHTIRQTICDALTSYMNMASTLPSVCGERVREHIYKGESEIEAVAMFLLIALLDFRSVVCMTEDGNEECRVFDQNERYNIFLEETVWTDACAQYMLAYKHTNSSVIEVISKDMYRRTFDKLCGDNVEIFTRMVKGKVMDVNDALNPKIALLVSKLK